MSKKLITVLVVVCMLLSAVQFSVGAAGVTTLYVSPSGDDSNIGTLDSPLATMDGARKRIATLKNSGTYINEGIFRGGDYRIKDTIKFTEEDSGTSENPIV